MNYRQPWHSPFKQRWFSRYNSEAQLVRIGGVGQTREMESCSLLKFWFKSEVKRMDDLNKTDIMKAMKLLESNWNYNESILQKQKHFHFALTVILRQYWYREHSENCFTFSNILLL